MSRGILLKYWWNQEPWLQMPITAIESFLKGIPSELLLEELSRRKETTRENSQETIGKKAQRVPSHPHPIQGALRDSQNRTNLGRCSSRLVSSVKKAKMAQASLPPRIPPESMVQNSHREPHRSRFASITQRWGCDGTHQGPGG